MTRVRFRPGKALAGLLGAALLALVAFAAAAGPASAAPAAGPLVVSPDNPRYFTAAGGDGTPIYLTGSHLWNNLQDGAGAGSCENPPPDVDWNAYLEFLADHEMNFIRLWRWEQPKFKLPPEYDEGGPYCNAPQPWLRTGPGNAADGKPKFDLESFDPDYFERLKERVIAADEAGIYVDVMLFEGFCLHICDEESAVAQHPFDEGNNVNGIDIDSIADYQALPLDPAVRALQRRYIRKVVKTVQASDNVLYEVANESYTGSVSWQNWVVKFVKRFEARKGFKAHPIGVTAIYPGGEDKNLFASPADWISPGLSDADYNEDPLAASGAKVVISDTDHYLPCGTEAVWAWKSFTRGLNPIMIDCGIADPANPAPEFEYLEPTRNALGDSNVLSREIDLAQMPPRGDLTSTEYALADPGQEYVVFQPSSTLAPFTVTLEPGTYEVDWFDVDARTWSSAEAVTITTAGSHAFTPPFLAGSPAVLHLTRE